MKYDLRLGLALTAALIMSLPMLTQSVASRPLTRGEPPLSTAVRAHDLLDHMTLNEKASQLQNDSPAISRLGIPAYNWWSEGLHGVARAGDATVFPQVIGMAASWNTPLIKQVGDITSTEFRAKYLKTVRPDGGSSIYQGLTVWSPNVNIFRDPRWGRGQETFGEDPFLTSQLGVAYIQGLQGSNPDAPKVSATVKHLAVHSGPEADRHREDVYPSRQDLIDTYLPAFHAAVADGRILSVMCAYNAVDGEPACANTSLLKDYLRTSWKFRGHVVSDCGAVSDIYADSAHHYAKTAEEAVAVAIKAGTDLFCEFGGTKAADPATTVAAVKQGLLTEAEVDQAVLRLLEARINLGLLELPEKRPFKDITASDYDTPSDRALNLEVARQSLVLLKNDDLLPLRSEPKRIAVIGPNANSVDALVGNYSGTPSRPITILDGIKARFPEARITYVEGTGWVAPPLQDIPDGNLCLDQGCTAQGVKLEHFENLNLEGAPSAVETVSKAELVWGWPNAYDHKTSVRWTSYVRAVETGMHNFRLTGSQGYRVKVDGKLVADLWDIAWPTSKTEVRLEAGKVYKIEIEAQQTGYNGEQKLQWTRPSFDDTAAVDAARDADLILFVGGLTWQLEGEEMTVHAPGFSGGDRTSIDLPAPQEALLETLGTLHKPLVLINMSGSAMGLNWADKNVGAIVQAWYPGGEGGRAVAELLAGDFSPAGRLPVTFYKTVGDLPPFNNYSMKGRTYRYFKGEPLYPFGYGLSYTRFAYSVETEPKIVRAGTGIKLLVDVKNIGQVDGDEVVQVYVTRTEKTAPNATLVGFTRVHLKAGETRQVPFALAAKAFSTVDVAGNRIVDSGPVEIWIGGGQPVRSTVRPAPSGIALHLSVKGHKALPQF